MRPAPDTSCMTWASDTRAGSSAIPTWARGYSDRGLDERLALGQPSGRRLVGAVPVPRIRASAQQDLPFAEQQQVNVDDQLE